MAYVRRGLARCLNASQVFPVTILEGRRAVGKTTLTRRLERDSPGYAFYSLLPSGGNLAAARRNPVGWLESLPQRCVIDEAQQLEYVTQYVKDLVDRLDSKRRFILTGSATVGRERAGSPDWLTGRANRLELLPFSASELSGRGVVEDYSLVDALFNEHWDGITVDSEGMDSLLGRLRRGGMPNLCLPGRDVPIDLRDINHVVAAEVDLALGRDVLPGQVFDSGIARMLLDALLRAPGGLLNRLRLAGELGIDQRTVSRYLEVLSRRFLIHFLPNLRGSVTGLNRRQQKVHAVDTSNVCESVARAGHDISHDISLMGQAFETWVVNQVRAENGWARRPCRLGYWRETSNNREYEVDLVLLDEQNRVVAIEVKRSSEPSPRDFIGIKRLRESCVKQGWVFHRGFVVCTTAHSRPYGDKLWAIPYQALGEYPIARRGGSFDGKDGRESAPVASVSSPVGSVDVVVFMSCLPEDDAYLWGAITALGLEVARAYRFQTGEHLEVLTDRDGTSWKENWNQSVRRAAGAQAFLIAAVTPGYLKSEVCRSELTAFASRLETGGHQGILPLIIQPLGDSVPPSPARELVERYRFRDVPVADGWFSPQSVEFRRIAADIAQHIRAEITKPD
ncbi:DUF4143 domain-containing protein [Mobiluncus mulieris]|uniref:ATP-binding protein n=1 Tax=Mobiluncus mulieris TaxID=2052 RepID=UPI0014706507|nr:DUF4143 domain-containing protein [Mobiluncus mulieris]MCU9996056.1 DUF4143 domain-containing protein [Mobiluncus mulieris]NMW61498.1 DUF4143 domain-containing protein [Mobiluncus mulieris]